MTQELYSVSLIDRRTGRPHRVNGTPLAVFTRSPEEEAANLLRHRDPAVWDVRISALTGQTPKTARPAPRPLTAAPGQAARLRPTAHHALSHH